MTTKQTYGLVAQRLAVTLMALIAAFAVSAAPSYTAASIPADGRFAYGTAINFRGDVTGYAAVPNNVSVRHAFLSSGAVLHDLGALDADNSYGYSINAVGQITGSTLSLRAGYRVFLYSGGIMTDLGMVGVGTAINANGQIAGSLGVPGHQRAFLYTAGVVTDLGTLGGLESHAFAVNAGGQVTGKADVNGYAEHAFLYSGGSMRDLGTLGGGSSAGYGINDNGHVTGIAQTGIAKSDQHAFLYSAAGMSDLGTLGGLSSAGHSINARGQVVGASQIAADSRSHAFLYSDGQMYDLNSLVVSGLSGKVLSEAIGINDSGQIVANSCSTDGTECYVYRLDPLAQPTIPTLSNLSLGALALFLLGCTALLRCAKENQSQ
jgi:probable HAF family extracellular repeat protein